MSVSSQAEAAAVGSLAKHIMVQKNHFYILAVTIETVVNLGWTTTWRLVLYDALWRNMHAIIFLLSGLQQ